MKTTDRSGFTVVELMAGLVATAILILTVGALMWFSAANWRQGNTAVNLRRDAAFAMQLMARAARSSSLTNITVGSGSLIIPPTQFLQSSNSQLIYIPNTGAPGNQMVVIKSGLDLFQSATTNGTLSVHLRLKANNVLADLQATYDCRN